VRDAFLTAVRNPFKALFVGLIRAYQLILSPGLPGRCKYYPSCSEYALQAVKEYGALRGSVLAGWRILRCNPLSYGGYDPISRQKLFARRTGGASLVDHRSCGHDAGHCPAGVE
jgi:uncharacterized protein